LAREKIEAAAEWMRIADLAVWDKNPRLNDTAAREVAHSIIRFGFGAPVVARREDGFVIAGHSRLKAVALLRDWYRTDTADEKATWSADAVRIATDADPRVPVRRLDISEAEAKALALADEWDDGMLGDVLRELAEHDVDLTTLGFSPSDLDSLVVGGTARATPPLELPPDPGPPPVADGPADSVLGRVYQLGPHRLICGDCRDSGHFGTLLDGRNPDAIVTDPPYGTGINASGGLGNSKVPMNILGDESPDLARECFNIFRGLAPIQVWWGANYYCDVLPGSPCWAVWDKDHHGMTFADAELAWVSVRGPVRVFRHAWSGMHRASERGTVRQHPTQKPVALYEWTYEQWIPPGALIVDLFLGSGSSLIGAARTGRTLYGFELDPHYCDVIRRRWTVYARDAKIDPGTGALAPLT
jgi:hypothetical protein